MLASGRNAERRLPIRVEPEYPETLKQLHIGGTVRLALTISPKGTLERVALLGGNPMLAEAAAKAAKRWVYAPASSQTTVEFSLPSDAHP